MGNILNHNRTDFYIKLNDSEYWDFHLYKGRQVIPYQYGFQEKCLISYIDIPDTDCVGENLIQSKKDYVWEEASNIGVTLSNIGYTGVDNGLITYNKYEINQAEFLHIYQDSEYTTTEGDKRLKLYKVGGNNQIFSYNNDFVEKDNTTVAKLNGGFFQGAFQTDNKCDFSLLPTIYPDGITLEFVLNRENFDDDSSLTLNKKHPDNKGIFFYIGTRAENKWWKYYDTEEKFEKNNTSLFDGYTKGDNVNNTTNNSYINTITEPNHSGSKDVVKEDELRTKGGLYLIQPNYHIYETENKFLLFDRTKDGLTVETFKEGDKLIIADIDYELEENPYLLFDRTKKGYTVETADDLYEKNSKQYSVVDDIVENAFALTIKDDNSVGYKYLIRDCDAENKYRIVEEYSNKDTVPYKEWVVIDVRIIPNVQYPIRRFKENNKMRLMIYVNGDLVLYSKELPLFNFRLLNEPYEKQEFVPYNISLGGGTQGLADTIYYHYMEEPEYILPLEKYFGGSFIGYVKSFKFYNCSLNYNEIRENCKVELYS